MPAVVTVARVEKGCGCCVPAQIGQSCVCLVRGWRAAAELGDTKKKTNPCSILLQKKGAPADQNLMK